MGDVQRATYLRNAEAERVSQWRLAKGEEPGSKLLHYFFATTAE